MREIVGFLLILAVQVVMIPAWLQALQNLLAWAFDMAGIPFNVACAFAQAIVNGIAASLGF